MNGVNRTDNFHMFIVPTFTWSRVTIGSLSKPKNLIIAVNFLPLEPNRTKWFVTICHNYHTSFVGKLLLQWMAYVILYQDFVQLRKQYQDTHIEIKDNMLFQHVFSGEEALLWLRTKFRTRRKV
jgi:hypothetical protein